MAVEPVLISNKPAIGSPNQYSLPSGLDMTPTAVTALFDGSGAGGDFLACLSFYAQSGELLARSFPSDTVTAGDSVEVSYAPFLRSEAATPSGTTDHPWIRRILRTGGPLSVNTAPGSTVVPWDHLDGSDDVLTFFASIGTDGIQLLQDGLYGVLVVMEWTPGHLGFSFWPQLAFPGGGGNYNNWFGSDPPVGLDADPANHSFFSMKRFPAAAVLRLTITQNSGANKNLNTAYMEVTYLGSFTGPSPFSENPNY